MSHACGLLGAWGRSEGRWTACWRTGGSARVRVGELEYCGRWHRWLIMAAFDEKKVCACEGKIEINIGN